MSPAASSTAVPGGGGGATVMALVPLMPGPVAVIVADPGATAVTTPPADTAATDGIKLAQVSELLVPGPAVAASRRLAPGSSVAPAGSHRHRGGSAGAAGRQAGQESGAQESGAKVCADHEELPPMFQSMMQVSSSVSVALGVPGA